MEPHQPLLHHAFGAVQHHGDGHHPFSEREQRDARLDLAHFPGPLPVPFREHTHHCAGSQRVESTLDSGTVGLAPVDRERSQYVDELAQRLELPELGLGHEVDLPGERDAHEERVQVGAEQHCSGRRDVLDAFDLHAKEAPPHRRDEREGESVEQAVERAADHAAEKVLLGLGGDRRRAGRCCRRLGRRFRRRGEMQALGLDERAHRLDHLRDGHARGVDLHSVAGLVKRHGRRDGRWGGGVSIGSAAQAG